MGWQNIGDMNPRSGTLVVRDLQLEDGVDFRAEAIEVIPESQVGGSDAVFDLRQGEIFLAAKNFESALEVVGARLEGNEIVRPGLDADEERFSIHSDEGLLELVNAAHAYGGVEEPSSTLVRIGLPSRYDPEPRFDGEIVIYPEATSLWAVMRQQLDGFDLTPEETPGVAIPYDTWDGPFANMPRVLQTRADLMQIGAFRDLEVDAAGNPKVYRLEYKHDDCREVEVDEDSSWQDWPEWEETAATHMTEPEADADCDCPECGDAVSPHACRWIGPEDAVLCDLWEDLPAADVTIEATPEPGF